MAHENHQAFLSDNGRKVHAVLSDTKFRFRTLIGMAKACNLSEQDVLAVIESARDVVHKTKNRVGTPLFCLSE